MFFLSRIYFACGLHVAGRCHCEVTLGNLLSIAAIGRSAQRLMKVKYHSYLQEGQEGGPR